MAIRTALLVLCAAVLVPGCASKGDEMRVVVRQKTTYLHAETVDGGPVEVPPRVLEEVRPAVPDGVGNAEFPPSVVVRFAIDTEGRIGEIEISRATDDRLTKPAIEAISRWKLRPALRDGQAIAVVATVQLTFDVTRTGQ
jgi:protein TonB